MVHGTPKPARRLGRATRTIAVRPPSPSALATYTQRMNRVLDHIDSHIDETLEIAPLARVAHFSPFHFHRIFTAWMGETLGDYLRRRRLEVAAARLAGQHRQPILHIALSVGFGSGEAFARAFKTHFGQTPSAWRATTAARWTEELHHVRRRSNPDQLLRKPDQEANEGENDNSEVTNTPPQELKMQVTLSTLPPTRVAYLRHIGPYGPSISAFWQQKFLPWMHANQLEGRPCYGLAHDDPGITAPANCRYDACVEVTADFSPRGQAGIALLPGGRYALADYRGNGPGIERAWIEFLRDWLPNSGLQIDSRPVFEHYPVDAKYDPGSGEFNCQLCLPVKPL